MSNSTTVSTRPVRGLLTRALALGLAVAGAVVCMPPPASAVEPAPEFLTAWGTPGTATGQIGYPSGVDTDSTGHVYVADYDNNRVLKFTGNGTFVRSWGSGGRATGQFDGAWDVAVDANNFVYVADTGNNRIQKFTNTGTFVTSWGTSIGSGAGEFQIPVAVDTDAAGNVYVVDAGNHRVQKFTSAGEHLRSWGSQGTGNGRFSNPAGIAVAPGGDVYVVDYTSDRVQRFTSSGTFVSAWGSSGYGPGQLAAPYGIATDSDGNVFVTDSSAHHVQKFTGSGTLLSSWGSEGSGDGEFLYPWGIGVNASDQVFVVDSTSRVQKFDAVLPPNTAPVIAQSSPSISVVRDGSGSVTLSASDVDADPLSWSVITQPSSGSVSIPAGTGSSKLVSYTPSAGFVGSDSFRVQVSDGQGGTASVWVAVTVSPPPNTAPVIATSSPSISVLRNQVGSVTLSASDVDGDPLSWSVMTQPSSGSVSIPAGTGGSKQVSYTPAAGFVGSDSFRVQVSDGNGGTASVWVAVTVSAPPNTAPVIATSSPSISVLRNQTGSVTLSASDVDGDPLTWSVMTQPGNGSVSIPAGTGSSKLVSYTPTAGFVGSDSFRVQVSDGKGGVASVWVAVTVSAPPNTAPVIATSSPSISVLRNQAGSVTLSASDVDGDALSWSVMTQPSSGSVSIPAGTGSSKLVSYTPVSGFTGADSFRVQVADGKGGSASVWVSVTVSLPPNTAPVIAQSSPSISLVRDGSGSVTLSASDVDGDALSWSVMTQPGNGSVSIPAGTGGSKQVSYTPAAGFTGSDSFRVQVADGQGGTASVWVSVTVSLPPNTAPVIATSSPSIAVLRNQAGSVSLSASDVDGDALSWSLSVAPSNGSVSIPAGTGGSKQVSYTPAAGFTGSDSFRVQVADGKGGSASVWVSVTVSEPPNTAPVIAQSSPSIAVLRNQTGSVELAAEDADGDLLTWSITSPASNGEVSLSALQAGATAASYTPTEDFVGTDAFTVRVSDGRGGTASVTVDVRVSEPENRAPTVSVDALVLEMDRDTVGSVDLAASDADGDALTWRVSSTPAEGTVDLAPEGSGALATYTPTAGFVGEDSFEVEVSDGRGGVDHVSVTVTVRDLEVQPVQPIVSLVVTPGKAVRGAALDVEVTLVDESGGLLGDLQVTLERSIAGGPWTPVDSGSTDAYGVWVTQSGALENARYRAVVNATEHIATAQSAEAEVSVRRGLTVRSRAAGKRVVLVGRVTPVRDDRLLVVQVRRGGTWRRVARPVADAEGAWRVKVDRGTYRVVVAADQRFARTVSGTIKRS